jgi:hypothetical protein
MATKKINKQTGLTRNECINLYSVIRDIKSNGLSKDGLIAYIMLRLKLKEVVEQFEKVRTEIAEQTKPDGWKEGDSMKEWDEAFRPVMQKWLSEEVDIDTKIFTKEECADLISSNPDLNGSAIDLIVSGLLKE